VFEYEAARIHAGDTIDVEFPYGQASKQQARIEFVYPEVDPQTRRVRFRAVLPNPERKLKPDTYVTLVWHGEAIHQVADHVEQRRGCRCHEADRDADGGRRHHVVRTRAPHLSGDLHGVEGVAARAQRRTRPTERQWRARRPRLDQRQQRSAFRNPCV